MSLHLVTEGYGDMKVQIIGIWMHEEPKGDIFNCIYTYYSAHVAHNGLLLLRNSFKTRL